MPWGPRRVHGTSQIVCRQCWNTGRLLPSPGLQLWNRRQGLEECSTSRTCSSQLCRFSCSCFQQADGRVRFQFKWTKVLKTSTLIFVLSNLLPHNPRAATSSLAWSSVLADQSGKSFPDRSCSSCSIVTSCTTSLSRLAVMSQILLRRNEGQRTEHGMGGGERLPAGTCKWKPWRCPTVPKQMASWKPVLCIRKPKLQERQQVGQLDVPFSAATSRVRLLSCPILSQRVDNSAA